MPQRLDTEVAQILIGQTLKKVGPNIVGLENFGILRKAER